MTGLDGARRPLVIGIGNRLRGDDGIGPIVVDLLRAGHRDAIDTTVVAGDLSDLAMRWVAGQTVVIVDAMVSGRDPGTVIVFDGPTLSGSDQLLSSHGIGLADAIALARAIGRLPRSLTIVGIEGRAFEPGDPVSEPVRAAATVAVDRVAALTGDREVGVGQI